jgi:hypothetical protein
MTNFVGTIILILISRDCESLTCFRITILMDLFGIDKILPDSMWLLFVLAVTRASNNYVYKLH